MNASLNRPVITGIGAVTAVGGNAAMTCASIHANIISVQVHPVYRCKPLYPDEEKPLPLLCCRVPFINVNQVGAERLMKLAIPALRETLDHAYLHMDDLSRGKLFVALPEPDAETQHWGLEEGFIANLCMRTGIYDIGQKQVKLGGRNSVFELIADACAALAQGECDFCIVGGVDSYIFQHRLEALDQEWLLRSKRNSDGFTPGEAASFVFIESAARAASRQVRALASINAVSFGNEPHHAATKRKSTGVGLTSAVEQVSAASSDQFNRVYSDLNGESYAAFEWGVAQVRAADYLSSSFSLFHPAECYGDVGAATGALLLSLAARDLALKTQRKPNPVLLFATAAQGGRAAISLNPIT